MKQRVTLPLQIAGNTEFREYVQKIHDALAASGLVQTADTGQINPATVNAAGATGTSQGYEIWRFADGEQATAPIFFKVEYGSGASSITRPSMWITMGSGSNGAGTLTGQLTTRTTIASGVTLAVGSRGVLWVSQGSGYVACMVGYHKDNSARHGFAIDRPRDAAGGPLTDGATICAWSTSAFTQCAPAAGAVPAQDSFFSAHFPRGGHYSGEAGAAVNPLSASYGAGKHHPHMVCCSYPMEYGSAREDVVAVIDHLGDTRDYCLLGPAWQGSGGDHPWTSPSMAILWKD